MALTTSQEVVVYGETFLAILKQSEVKEKEQEQQRKVPNSPLNDQPNLPENNGVDNTSKKILAVSLTVGKEIAKNKIRQLFNQYRPDPEKIRVVWQGKTS